MAVALPLGVLAATRPNTPIDHACRLLATAGVSLPAFFTGLLLVYISYYLLGWVPAPFGRLDAFSNAPPPVTGFLTIDSLIAGDGRLLLTTLAHLALPAITLGIFALAPYDPLATNTVRALEPPSRDHWFGTDQVGRDIFSHLLMATRLDLLISVTAVTLSFVLGSCLGACAGYFRGWTDRVVTRLIDAITAFPLFVLAMGIVAALGNTMENIIYATAIFNLPFYARMARTEVNTRREAGFIEAARLSGNGDVRILTTHIFPNTLPPMMVQISLNLGWSILNAASVSFIGLGVRPRRDGALRPFSNCSTTCAAGWARASYSCRTTSTSYA